MERPDLYNPLCRIINETKDQESKEHAKILLSQVNTAGGSELMREEVTNFLDNYNERFNKTTA